MQLQSKGGREKEKEKNEWGLKRLRRVREEAVWPRTERVLKTHGGKRKLGTGRGKMGGRTLEGLSFGTRPLERAPVEERNLRR